MSTNPYVNISIFFTPQQQETFSKYSHEKEDGSLVTKVFSPFWTWLAGRVPTYVAPNVLNIAGLLCLLQGFYLCFMYIEQMPRTVSLLSLLLLLAYHNLDSISGKHARNIGNDSPLGELFQYSCSNVGVVFTSLTLCYVMGIRHLPTLWFAVQIAQLVCLREHVQALKRGFVRIHFLGGEGEAIWSIAIVVSLRVIFGLEPFQFVIDLIRLYADSYPISTLYYTLFVYTLGQCIFVLPYGSRNGVSFCLLYRGVPAVLIYLNLFSEKTLLDIVCDGLFMSTVTTDLIVAKMAGRDLHPWLVIMAMGSLLSNFLSLFIVFFYYLTIISEAALFMNLPVFSVVRNVYVDGVYDMCHLGHKLVFKKAIKMGTRLFVGVINDEDAINYKRKPIMTTEERERSVAACKYVHKVISNAPCFGITREFIEEHNIHVVGCSEEYDTPDDIYYKVAREMGISRSLPRTKGMSTSELIRRVVAYGDSLKADAAAQERESAKVEKDKVLNK